MSLTQKVSKVIVGASALGFSLSTYFTASNYLKAQESHARLETAEYFVDLTQPLVDFDMTLEQAQARFDLKGSQACCQEGYGIHVTNFENSKKWAKGSALVGIVATLPILAAATRRKEDYVESQLV